MEQIYNKLVRDKIPNIIKENGEIPVVRVLDEIEYKIELERKLHEEYQEVIESSGDDRVEELADMLEVIKALAKLENKDLNDAFDDVSFDWSSMFENTDTLNNATTDSYTKGM